MATTKTTTKKKETTTTPTTTTKKVKENDKVVEDLKKEILNLKEENKKHPKVVDDLNFAITKMLRNMGELEKERDALVTKCQELKKELHEYKNRSFWKRLFNK